jgi:DNA-directed RNA polymerase subunit L
MENVKLSMNGYRMDAEIKNVPVAFVNALRRICLSEVPTAIITNVEIVENTSSMTHEMVRHRTEQLPLNVRAEESGVIRDTKIELKIGASDDEPLDVTTDDFVVTGPRKNVLLYDRDLDQPILFMRLQPGEKLHIRASLGIAPTGVSQVCVSTFKNHIDPERVEVDRGLWIDNGGDPREFDNFHVQRSYAVDENGRPYWFDFAIESIGTMKAKDIVKKGAEILQEKINEFVKVPVLREEANWYRIEMEGETHTLGALVQTMIYDAKLVDYVSYTIGHPLVPKLVVRFNTKATPESVVERFKAEALALCENVLKSV